MKKQAVLSLSGGMDSSTLLLHLLANGYDVTALSFDYGQKHKVELERAQSLVDYVNEKNCGCGGKAIYGNLKHQIIKLDGLSDWMKFGIEKLVIPNPLKLINFLLSMVMIRLIFSS